MLIFSSVSLHHLLDCGYTLCGHGGTMKDAGMRIRIEPELREEFVELCRKNDVPAAQVLRAFMRDFIKTNSSKTKQLGSFNAKKALR